MAEEEKKSEPDVKFVFDDPEHPDSETDEEKETPVKTEDVHEKKEEPKAEDVVPREHYENLKKALREARGLSKAEIGALRKRVNAYEEQLKGLQEEKDNSSLEDLFAEYSDDDVITVAGVKKIVEQQKTMLERRNSAIDRQLVTALVQMAEQTFMTSHKDYTELTAPYQDLLKDKDFVQKIMSEGPMKAPQKFYDYAKSQLKPTDIEAKVQKEMAKKLEPVKKPKTMGKKSHSASAETKLSELTIEEKRKKLKGASTEKLDELWAKLLEEEGKE